MLLWNQNIGYLPKVLAIAEGPKRYSPIVMRVTTNWTSEPDLALRPVWAQKLTMRRQQLQQHACPHRRRFFMSPKRSVEAVSKHTLGLDDYIN